MDKEELLQEIKSLRMSCNAFYQLMIDRIRDLEKENAELKEKLNFSTQYYQGEKVKQQLTKAIDILKKYHKECPSKYSFEDIDDMAEHFLSEVENEKHQRKEM